MINIRTRQAAREIGLTLGAALGVLCIAAALATPLLGIRLLVFQSGSMSPTIETGGVALTRTVDAAELERGDIVMLTSSEGTRVTHRVAAVDPEGSQTRLTLRGDANQSVDRETYRVSSVDRVFWHANGLGYLVRMASSPYVILIAGGAALGLIMVDFGRQQGAVSGGARSRRTRTKIIGTAAVAAAVGGGVLTVGLKPGVVATLASFSDTAEVTSTFTTTTVPTPGASQIATDDDDVDCTNGTWLSGVIWVGWTKLPNPPANYQYQVDVYLDDPSSPDVTYTVNDKMATIKRGDLTHGAGTYRARVYGAINGTNWRSIDNLERTIEVGSGGLDIRCSDPYTTRSQSKPAQDQSAQEKPAQDKSTQDTSTDSSDQQQTDQKQDESTSEDSASKESTPDVAQPESSPSATTKPEPTKPEASASASPESDSTAAESESPAAGSDSTAAEEEESACPTPKPDDDHTPSSDAPERTAAKCSVPDAIDDDSAPQAQVASTATPATAVPE